MHFVARNATDQAYQAQGYSLRQDPLLIFKQPPSHLKHAVGDSTSHRRTDSSGSIKQMNMNALQKNTDHRSHEAEFLLGNKTPVKEKEAVSSFLPDHDCRLEGCTRVTINIAGQRYETQLKTLNRLSSTLLGNPSKRQQFWDVTKAEYFFDRHRPSFPAILYYYQSGGRLKRPVEVPLDIFLEELEFYDLGDEVIEEFKISEGLIPDIGDVSIIDVPEHKLKRILWEIFENPGSSIIANIVAILSVIFILISVATFCVETLPQFQNSDCVNVTVQGGNGSTVSWVSIRNYLNPMFIIESCCIAWFVFELGIRFIVCPSKLKFCKELLNWIDLAAIAPYFVFLVMFFIENRCAKESKFLSVLRVLRVVRIFKLSRFSDGLRILGKTLRVSLRELSMFLLFLAIGVVIFAGAIYYAEAQADNSFFVSIPDAFWWAVISMTTVGYGDVYPTGMFGKLIGGMCVLTGLLAIALPVPVIVTNFNNIYRQTTGRGYSC